MDPSTSKVEQVIEPLMSSQLPTRLALIELMAAAYGEIYTGEPGPTLLAVLANSVWSDDLMEMHQILKALGVDATLSNYRRVAYLQEIVDDVRRKDIPVTWLLTVASGISDKPEGQDVVS